MNPVPERSVTAKSLMQLNPDPIPGIQPGKQHSSWSWKAGTVDVLVFEKISREVVVVRGGAISMIFQEPMASFAPAITIGGQMVEQLSDTHFNVEEGNAAALSVEMLETGWNQ